MPPERRHILLAVEEEEVADLVDVDLVARALPEPRERLDAPQPERDVQRIRELSTKAAGGAARRSAGELALLDEADVDVRLCEMERSARPDHSPSDDDDVGRSRERAHRRTRFRRKNATFAGRSASLRMK
jgi:hypothetical protein